jgi:phosphatidylglycerophosphate synthase
MAEYEGKLGTVHVGLAVALIVQILMLMALAATVGLGGAGWVVGLACAVVLYTLIARSLAHGGSQRLGPADWVTVARAALVVDVAALTADSFVNHVSVATLVSLATAALCLDYVDGRVARHTRTESRLGSALDGEVDAFLILTLSLYVAPAVGWWVLAIGAARYAFLAAGWLFAWMRAPLPRRDWRKVVTAVQGIALVIASADVLPRTLTRFGLAVALALLAESFGRDVYWLWSHRHASADAAVALAQRGSDPELQPAGHAGTKRRRFRTGMGAVLTILALLIVWVALLAPIQPQHFHTDAFVRLPVEALALVALALALPSRGRRFLPYVVGPVLGVLVLIKLLDAGFLTAFDRTFNPVEDWYYAPLGAETLGHTVGRTRADLIETAVVLIGIAALVLPILAVRRLIRVSAGNLLWSRRVVTALGGAWLVCWALGAQFVPGIPIASMSASTFVVQEVRAINADLNDPAIFAAEIRRDRYRSTPGNRLLTALRGKDVLLIFMESYGQVAVQGSSYSPQVDAVLRSGTLGLGAAGFSSRSGWLASPTFGGISWLAHSTMQAGVWVDRASRYDELMASHRFTLTEAFKRAGWRVIDEVPTDDRPWSQGFSFYHFDKLYNRNDVGYHGPTYAFASMPDQYTYLALQRLELGKRHRRPLFAEIDTVSSHIPWTRVPPLIPSGEVGDGSIFKTLPVDESGITDPQGGYASSIEYSLRALFSFVEHYGRKNLVVIMLGDHQPAHIISGFGANHDVPVSIIAHDPEVLRRISSWGWVDSMQPTPTAPVWRMSAFRDRFLSAFGPRPASG